MYPGTTKAVDNELAVTSPSGGKLQFTTLGLLPRKRYIVYLYACTASSTPDREAGSCSVTAAFATSAAVGVGEWLVVERG